MIEEEKVEIDVIKSYIDDLQLQMKPVKVEFVGEGVDKQLFVFFVAKKRVDFNILVRRLYARHRCRIEMRWISTREHAMMIEEGMAVCPNGKIPCFRPWCQKNRFGGCYYDKTNCKNCNECEEQCL